MWKERQIQPVFRCHQWIEWKILEARKLIGTETWDHLFLLQQNNFTEKLETKSELAHPQPQSKSNFHTPMLYQQCFFQNWEKYQLIMIRSLLLSFWKFSLQQSAFAQRSQECGISDRLCMTISLEQHGYFAAKKLMQMLSKPHPSPNENKIKKNLLFN